VLYKNISAFKQSVGYYIDGIWYPRVTSILSIKAKPGLYAYYASMPSFRAGKEVTNRSAREGQSIHDTVEALLKNECPSIPDSIRPSIDAFLEFLRNNDITPVKIEERIVSRRHHYAGTIDVLAEINGVLGVLDIKTSQAVYREYGMQTAAYVEALQENPDMPKLASWVLLLDQIQKCVLCNASKRQKGGRVKIKGGTFSCPHQWTQTQGRYEFTEIKDFDLNIKAFLAAKELWMWEHKEYLERL